MKPRRLGNKTSFMLGFVGAFAILLSLGEAYLRLWLPRDVRDYFGGSTGADGIYRRDPELGVAYRSYADFAAENAPRLAELGPLASAQPTWLFLGNSFVQAPGRSRPRRRLCQAAGCFTSDATRFFP